MNRRFITPPEVIHAQRRASDPGHSAWVAANAGSGKTYVLARRVVRLMLAGAPPGAILCLTFTKAAAATMANRVFALLSEWTALPDAALAAALRDLDGSAPTPERLVRARRLFAEALETPGGLKVQTIHAFCERVLHQFPFEANVASRFTVLDEAAEVELIGRAKTAVLLEAARAPDGPLGRAMALLATLAADQTVDGLLAEAACAKDALAGLPDDAGLLADGLGAALGLSPADTEAGLAAEVLDAALVPPSEWPAVATALERASAARREQEAAGILRAIAARPQEGRDLYEGIFLTAQGEPRKDVVTKAVRDREPALAARLEAEKQRLAALRDRRRAVALRDGTAALMVLARAVRARIEAEKALRGALDFDDLIRRTRALFARVDARWILYKLDQGIDHILVDEAQDTSPAQWELVSTLVEEFTAGAGARAVRRTLFVVGDEKQSIYSFQGADPRWFERMKRHFSGRFSEAGLGFETVPLVFSFRSTPAVLGAVDRVFEALDARRGLTGDGGPINPHEAARAAAPGLVELWPLTVPEPAEDRSPWTAPLDAMSPSDPVARLAGRIAAHARLWLDEHRRLPDKAEPIRAGDVLVLVRRRGALFDAIIRALKNAGVPVAGADRLVLGEHIAVMDLLALADCLLTPDDDLSLATVLKSPLIGMAEDELMRLAAHRPGALWDALQASGHPAGPRLARWRQEALAATPADFFGRVLGRDRGRALMLGRLGSEAADALDEFMSLALALEADEAPTLRGFVGALRARRAEVKRDMEIGRDEVRVMTVHGAKGLEADIVVLADTLSKPSGRHDPQLFPLAAPGAPEGAPPWLVWSPSAKADAGPVAAARQDCRRRQEEEYRRLLYVAMTRAADKLIVCGAQTDPRAKSPTDGTWYGLIASALAEDAREEPADDGDGLVRRWSRGNFPARAAAPEGESAPLPQNAPAWLARPAPAPPAAAAVLVPSAAAPGRRIRFSAEAARRREAARRHGALVHRLIQSLPDVPAEQRAAAAARFLGAQADIDAATRAAAARTVDRILADPRFAVLFGPDSRAEVPIAGRLNGRAVAGQIDRLVFAPDRIVIADYKTNDPPPPDLAATPDAYLVQLALYRALVGRAHPGRSVEAWLVWTALPDLLVVPQAALDDALARAGLAG